MAIHPPSSSSSLTAGKFAALDAADAAEVRARTDEREAQRVKHVFRDGARRQFAGQVQAERERKHSHSSYIGSLRQLRKLNPGCYYPLTATSLPRHCYVTATPLPRHCHVVHRFDFSERK